MQRVSLWRPAGLGCGPSPSYQLSGCYRMRKQTLIALENAADGRSRTATTGHCGGQCSELLGGIVLIRCPSSPLYKEITKLREANQFVSVLTM